MVKPKRWVSDSGHTSITIFSIVAEGGSGPTSLLLMMLYESHHSFLFLQTQQVELTPKSSIRTNCRAEMLLLLGDMGVDILSFKLKIHL